MTPEEIAVKLAEHDNRIKVSEHRLKDIEEAQKEIHTLTLSVHELALSLKSVVEEQKEQRVALNEIKSRPVKRLQKAGDKVIETILTVITTALITTALTLLALGL